MKHKDITEFEDITPMVNSTFQDLLAKKAKEDISATSESAAEEECAEKAKENICATSESEAKEECAETNTPDELKALP